MDAPHRRCQASQVVGVHAVVVEPTDDRAADKPAGRGFAGNVFVDVAGERPNIPRQGPGAPPAPPWLEPEP